ncbi:MAG: hypothetical protein RLZZ385_1962 [Pseudomonadota bacterium]|jgi:GlpG protein
MLRAASLDLDVDLQAFSQFLRGNGITHRINEESGQQVIWVADESQAAWVQAALQAWQRGDLVLPNPASLMPATAGLTSGLPRTGLKILLALVRAPITAVLMVLCAVVAAWTRLGRDVSGVDFLFYPPLPSDSLPALLAAIDGPLVFLQTLAPMFLHFGELHIIFNLLWLWYFGRQLEAVQAEWLYLLVIVVTSFVANTAQYFTTGMANFGGMSGVVYGLVGYVWIVHNFVPGQRMLLNNTMFVFFVVALVLMEVVASSWIASAAHAGGLLAGLILGILLALYKRLVR